MRRIRTWRPFGVETRVLYPNLRIRFTSEHFSKYHFTLPRTWSKSTLRTEVSWEANDSNEGRKAFMLQINLDTIRENDDLVQNWCKTLVQNSFRKKKYVKAALTVKA